MNKNQDVHIVNDPKNREIYENNIKAIKERYPEYFEIIEKTRIRKRYLPVVTGSQKRLNVFDNEKNHFYYKTEDYNEGIREEFEQLKLKNTRIAVFLGFGLGYEVDYYAKNMALEQRTEFIIIVEKDVELFKLSLMYLNYIPMFKDTKIILLLDMDKNNVFTTLENLLRKNLTLCFYLKCIKPVYINSALVTNNDYYINFLKVLRETVAYLLEYFGNSPEDSFIGIENILDNIEIIIENPGINLLYNKFKDKPAVIISTGPSLNKNKHLLKEIADKALFICPDASLPVLLSMGIKPHLLTALERVDATVDLVRGFTLEQVEDVYYAATPVIKREGYDVYPGPKIIVYRNFAHFKWIGIDRGILDIKHSSGNMAFKIAEALGCNPIILIGQDLAYGEDGKTHASGSVLGEIQKTQEKQTFFVKGNNGKDVLTYKTWDTFRKAYEIDINEYKGKCINSTEGGAFINGTDIMPFREAIDKFIVESFNPIEIIKNELSIFSVENIKSDVMKVKQIITETNEDLKKMKSNCREGFEYLKAIEEELNKIIDKELMIDQEVKILEEHFSNVLNIKQRLLKESKNMQLFLMHIIQSYIIKFEIDMNEYPDNIKKNHAKALFLISHIKWFAIISEIINLCIDLLNKTEDRVSKLEAHNSVEC